MRAICRLWRKWGFRRYRKLLIIWKIVWPFDQFD